jgi:hypothetical protein
MWEIGEFADHDDNGVLGVKTGRVKKNSGPAAAKVKTEVLEEEMARREVEGHAVEGENFDEEV